MAKDFKNINNPALQFISSVNEKPKQEEQTTPLAQKKTKETKSKRLQLLVYPSVYTACKEEADKQGESVNEIINDILKKHFTKEK